MVCLIRSKYKNELAEYKRILGSEEAAYYALAANNGYTLDLDPQGNPSKLYESLLFEEGGDKNAAITRKLFAYLPQFTESHDNWIENGKEEPSIVDLNNGEYSSDFSSISKILNNNAIIKPLQAAERNNEVLLKEYIIRNYIDDSRNAFVQQQVEKYITRRINPSSADVYLYRLSSQIDWDEIKVNEIIGEQQEKLAKAYGLKKHKRNDGSFIYISDDSSSESKLKVMFVNSISGKDWTDEQGVVHRGLFIEGTLQNEAAWNAILLSIQDGDATTFTHEMAHFYIRTFWDSEPVQSALALMNKSSSKEAEEALVEYLTSNVFTEEKSKFWRGINKILRILGLPIKRNKNIKNNVLDTLVAAFAINEDLSDRKAETIFFERYMAPMAQIATEPLDDKSIESKTFTKIKDGLESRQKSEKSRGKANNKDLLNVEYFLQRIKRRNKSNQDDVLNTVTDFLLLASQDIERYIRFLKQIKENGQDGIENLDVADFMHLKSDIIGYYDIMLEKVVGNFLKSENITAEQANEISQQTELLISSLPTLKRNFDIILEKYVNHQIDLYSEELVVVGDKDRFKANMKLWAKNQINNGNLAPFENTLGPAVVSQSPIVRLVEYIVTAQNRATYTQSLERGHDLVDKYKKCLSLSEKISTVNFMKKICELDDDGNPTGYFARKYNYGKVYKKREEIKQSLIKKYGIKVKEVEKESNQSIVANQQYIDESGELEFENKDQYIKYMTDFYNQMDKIANFRYKKEYYIERAKRVSSETLDILHSIQRQINSIVSSAYDEDLGMIVISNLTSEQLNKLEDLQKEKENLANPYIIDYNDDGSIRSFVQKEGDALKMALELMDWNRYKAEHLKYKPNYEKFEISRNKIIEKYGKDSIQLKRFDYKYKVKRISPKFYEMLDDQQSSDELRELYQRRSIIRNSILQKRGYYQPNLKLLNKQAFEELKRIDNQIASLTQSKKSNFKDVATKEWVNEYDNSGKMTSELAYNYFIQLEKTQRTSAGIPVDAESDYTYVNALGEVSPLSIFKYTKPRNLNFIEETLGGIFLEVDPSSDLINPNFDQNINEEVQPKNTKEFINKQWQEIQDDPKLKAFYDLILQTMREAYSMLPNMDANKMQYVMPQMRDRDAKLLFRNKHLLNNIGASIADVFSITETNTNYNEEFSKRPDGSSVETIPIRWIARLEDPSIISTDILKSTIMFYEMALNYKNKVDINPLLQAILFQTQGGFEAKTPGVDTSKQAQRIQNYLQIYVYGRTKVSSFNSSEKMGPKEQAASRITEVALAKAHAKLMNHNWRAILKNFIDSFLTETGEIFAGKYITVKDALWANKEMGKEIFSAFGSFGRANTKSKIAALMHLNGVSGSISEIFSQHNETWLRRVISKHFSMGEYTLVDYTFKGHLTAAVYHSIRLVKNPNTNKLEFMNKDQAMYQYQLHGDGIKEGLKQWKKAETTLFDVYDIDDKGNAVVNKDYEKYVYPYIDSIGKKSNRIVNQVAGVIRERSSVINGILDESGKASLSQSVLGSMALQMRGWMISQMWDNLKIGHDFAEYDDNGDDKYKIINEDPELQGQYNFETGRIETGQWRGLKTASLHAVQDLLIRLLPAYKHLRHIENSRNLTMNERYKLRRLTTMCATFIIISGCTYITSSLAAKYPENWFLNLLAAVNISAISERASQIPIFAWMSILDIVNSIFISKSLIDDADKFVDLLSDILEASGVYNIIGYTPDKHFNDTIKSGAYKGIPRWQRDVFKATSYTEFNVDNIFRSVSKSGNQASVNYYMQKVAPTKQAVGAANAFMPALLNFAGYQFDEPPKKKSKKKQKYHSF